MRMPTDGIQAFVEIARLGSFNRAADRLCITQTALSRRIQRLEAVVGTRLLDRTTRTTALTPVGREFLPFAERVIDELTYGLERLRTATRLSLGEVNLAVIQSVAFRQLPLALKIYADAYPRNRVQVLERTGTLVTEAVRQGAADFGIHVLQGQQPDLEEEELVSDPFVLVCSRNPPLAGRPEVAWKDLRGVDLITLGGASGNRHIVEVRLAQGGVETRGRFVVESTPSAIALARAGVGAAILPATMRASEVATGLIEIPLVDPVAHRAVGLVRRRNETLSPAAAALYDIVRAELGAAEKHEAAAT